LERSLDRLALGIQNAPLQRNVYVSFHGGYPDYTATHKMLFTLKLSARLRPGGMQIEDGRCRTLNRCVAIKCHIFFGQMLRNRASIVVSVLLSTY
jgi:hypothetical protein